jgi:outer membrane immunogenic protein
MRQGWGCDRGRTAGGAAARGLGRVGDRLMQFVALALALYVGVESSAQAADLPTAAPVLGKASAVPVYNWTGFYIGGNLGVPWSGQSGTTNFSDTLGSAFTAPTNIQLMGGGQAGVNYQFWGGAVIGAEIMFDALANGQTSPITATAPNNTLANIDAIDYRWLTTATVRLGYAWDRVLFYGKGGGAWVSEASPGITVNGASASLTSSNNSTFGWTAGFGVEWAFFDNWSLRGEWDYVGLNNQTFTAPAGLPTFGGDVITYNERSISLMTVAVNYKFGGW